MAEAVAAVLMAPAGPPCGPASVPWVKGPGVPRAVAAAEGEVQGALTAPEDRPVPYEAVLPAGLEVLDQAGVVLIKLTALAVPTLVSGEADPFLEGVVPFGR